MVTKLTLFFETLHKYNIDSNQILHNLYYNKEGDESLNMNMNNCIYFHTNLNHDANFASSIFVLLLFGRNSPRPNYEHVNILKFRFAFSNASFANAC
jgi:hypothetical protein